MFQLFGDNIYDSTEIAETLSKKYHIDVISDLSKSLKREDAMAFKCGISINLLEISETDIKNEENFLFNLEKCDRYIESIIESLDVKYSLHKCSSYMYDEYKKQIKFIICIMYIETARKKLSDTMKKLLKNND